MQDALDRTDYLPRSRELPLKVEIFTVDTESAKDDKECEFLWGVKDVKVGKPRKYWDVGLPGSAHLLGLVGCPIGFGMVDGTTKFIVDTPANLTMIYADPETESVGKSLMKFEFTDDAFCCRNAIDTSHRHDLAVRREPGDA